MSSIKQLSNEINIIEKNVDNQNQLLLYFALLSNYVYQGGKTKPSTRIEKLAVFNNKKAYYIRLARVYCFAGALKLKLHAALLKRNCDIFGISLDTIDYISKYLNNLLKIKYKVTISSHKEATSISIVNNATKQSEVFKITQENWNTTDDFENILCNKIIKTFDNTIILNSDYYNLVLNIGQRIR